MGNTSSGQNGRWAAVRDEVVSFLRNWLPAEAVVVYRAMILEDPVNWYRHPHFAGGIILEHGLRGNGIDERTLGVANLDQIWPELLKAAVEPQE